MKVRRPWTFWGVLLVGILAALLRPDGITGLRARAKRLTTSAGAKKIGNRLPPICELVAIGRGRSVDVGKAIAELRDRGFQVLLTEGGPHLIGQLIDEGLLDELFLTVSPVVAGRKRELRLGMVEGVELLPTRQVWSSLLSARRHGEFMFLRYRMPAPAEHA